MKKIKQFLSLTLSILGLLLITKAYASEGETIKVCPEYAIECKATYKGIEVTSEKCRTCGAIEIEEYE